MRRGLLSTVGAAVCVLAVTGVASAVTVTESGDAGSLPANAQATSGVVDLITGRLSVATDEDVYKVCLTGGKTFSATTEGSQFDTQLWLFNAQGRGVYGNWNSENSNDYSELPAGHPLTPDAGGVYYLAINGFIAVPVNQAGEAVLTRLEYYPSILSPDPVDPVVTGWTDFGTEFGSYRIALTGTRPCPAPTLPTTKDQCKNGRWRNYGDRFKNQGACVSFVATGGKKKS